MTIRMLQNDVGQYNLCYSLMNTCEIFVKKFTDRVNFTFRDLNN